MLQEVGAVGAMVSKVIETVFEVSLTFPSIFLPQTVIVFKPSTRVTGMPPDVEQTSHPEPLAAGAEAETLYVAESWQLETEIVWAATFVRTAGVTSVGGAGAVS